MESEYSQIPEITSLEQSREDGPTGALLAKHFERLLKRQYSELAQFRALSRDLERLPPGPTRKTIAATIRAYTADHARRIERHAAQLVREADTGKRRL